jgi:hypothetical protein
MQAINGFLIWSDYKHIPATPNLYDGQKWLPQIALPLDDFDRRLPVIYPGQGILAHIETLQRILFAGKMAVQ